MIDKITKAFTYVGKVNYISRRRFLCYVQKCEKTRNLATSYWTRYARIACVYLRIRALGHYAIRLFTVTYFSVRSSRYSARYH